jgi:phosphoserine phosphatase RsbU/P
MREAEMGEGDRKIVFVDDEVSILSALKRELLPWSRKTGLSIETFTSARTALEYLEDSASSVAVLVSDLRMPEILGSDFLLAAKDRWPEIPTILLSGYSEAKELMKAVKAGIFSYVPKPWDDEYLQAELDKALELRRTREEISANARRVEEELKFAGGFQKSFLRPTLKSTEGIEALASWRPVEGLYCGGDYYDVLNVGKKRYLALIGDVAGHGIKAAFVTGFLKAMIYTEYVSLSPGEGFSTARFLEWLNNRVCFELRKADDVVITFAAALLDLEAGTIRYSNAGHCKPWLLRDGKAAQLLVAGPALGSSSSVSYTEKVEALRKGDLLFMHTDGLSDVGTASGGKPVQLGSILAETPYGDNYQGRIMERALADSGAMAFEDDVAMLTIRIA